jgi:archaellum component FlaC
MQILVNQFKQIKMKTFPQNIINKIESLNKRIKRLWVMQHHLRSEKNIEYQETKWLSHTQTEELIQVRIDSLLKYSSILSRKALDAYIK